MLFVPDTLDPIALHVNRSSSTSDVLLNSHAQVELGWGGGKEKFDYRAWTVPAVSQGAGDLTTDFIYRGLSKRNFDAFEPLRNVSTNLFHTGPLIRTAWRGNR